MSSKHSGVRSCFEVFIEPNTPVQSDFDFDGVETIVFFIFKIMCMHVRGKKKNRKAHART